MFQAHDAGLQAEIDYRRERLTGAPRSTLTGWERPRRSRRGRRFTGGLGRHATR